MHYYPTTPTYHNPCEYNFILLSVLVVSPALHLAVMQGRLNNVRTLLTESNIDAEAFNLRYAQFLSQSDVSLRSVRANF